MKSENGKRKRKRAMASNNGPMVMTVRQSDNVSGE